MTKKKTKKHAASKNRAVKKATIKQKHLAVIKQKPVQKPHPLPKLKKAAAKTKHLAIKRKKKLKQNLLLKRLKKQKRNKNSTSLKDNIYLNPAIGRVFLFLQV